LPPLPPKRTCPFPQFRTFDEDQAGREPKSNLPEFEQNGTELGARKQRESPFQSNIFERISNGVSSSS
jgi:hypothetical protein